MNWKCYHDGIFSRAVLRPLQTGVLAGLLVFAAGTVQAQDEAPVPVAPLLLTNISQLWELPHVERTLPHRMQTEVVFYYYDREWESAWGECQGKPFWLGAVFGSPMSFQVGQRVAIDGIIIPERERFDWDHTKLRVLEDGVKFKAETLHNLRDHPTGLRGRFISVDGLIDLQMEDSTHYKLGVLVGDLVASAYVMKRTNEPAPTFQTGDYIRLQGVYGPQFSKDGELNGVDLWVSTPSNIKVIGSLSTDPRFDIPATPTEEIRADSPTNTLIRVSGVVHSHEQGKSAAIWDGTGQVNVQSKQAQPLRSGDRIEAIGYPSVLGVQQTLINSLYRLVVSTNHADTFLAGTQTNRPLRLAEQIRDLSYAETESHPAVNLRGMVTMSRNRSGFAYVQDASGGVRVVRPKWEPAGAWKPGTIVTVHGVVTMGDFVPVITNAILSQVGFWNLDESVPITLEQALTGAEDGRWVEMEGYVRDVISGRGFAHLNLTTAGGEFEALVPNMQPLDGMKGSIIKIQGVCVAASNDRHQLKGIQIWTPDIKYVQVEEPAPDDLFAVPFRALDSLRRFNMQSALNQRIRTAGTVVLQMPGRYLYVQDGVDSVFALSRQTDVLQPGDQVEVVGFPGTEAGKFLLREAVYRRVAAGTEPTPVRLSEVNSVNDDLAGRLTSAEGILLNQTEKNGELRLLIHSTNADFTASLDLATNAVAQPKTLELGGRVAVTGVYEVQSDENGKPRSFLVHLRFWKDIQILQQPPWWTLARLLWVLLAVLGVFLIALCWSIYVSRKNGQLRQAQGELQVANDRLELRVEERTQELREQVAAKERAHDELARTQQDLILASRQAGMAEVATGVLHNIGNVLNSVNVSAAMVEDNTKGPKISYLEKAVALLNEHHADLGAFLTTDPKGSQLPDFLSQIAGQLAKDQSSNLAEIESLRKNIDHIKGIVAMQQSYAKISGVTETVNVTELVEDALRMNAGALARHEVEVVREYAVGLPPLTVEKHKVLQVLVNLIRNAKYACDDSGRPDKRLKISALKHNGVFCIAVADNGIGIPPENLSRIFSQGFTTRKDGHGWGLHTGAIAAKELGGTLLVQSDGLGQGATFTLKLPAQPSKADV